METTPEPTPAAAKRTPEQLGRAVIAGFEDLDLVESLYPTDALLRAALNCPNDELFDGIAAMRRKAPTEMGSRPAGVRMVYVLTKDAEGYGEAQQLAPGDEISGCTVRMELEMKVFSVGYSRIEPGGTKLGALVLLFVRLGDEGWFVFE